MGVIPVDLVAFCDRDRGGLEFALCVCVMCAAYKPTLEMRWGEGDAPIGVGVYSSFLSLPYIHERT